jgi:hypothetical protein
MKRLSLPLLLALLAATTLPVCASITTQAIVGQDIQVILDLANMDPAIYNTTVQQGAFAVSTIPETINAVFEVQNLTNARCEYDPTQQIFRDSTYSIHTEFSITGSDILGFTVKGMTKEYTVRTDWRKFRVDLTNETSLDFAIYFATQVSQWDQINHTLNDTTHPAYFYNSTSLSQIDPEFYFLLPENAANIHAAGDTLIFEVPLSSEEAFLNSPFLILIVLVVVVVVAFLYRRIRR